MRFLKVIKSLADLDIAMVIVTHEMAFARDISDRVVFMAEAVSLWRRAPRSRCLLRIMRGPRAFWGGMGLC